MKEAWKGLAHADRVVFTGRLGQHDLRKALGGPWRWPTCPTSKASAFRGGGHALRCQCWRQGHEPAPEVAGEGLYCDPFDVDDIANGLRPLGQRAPGPPGARKGWSDRTLRLGCHRPWPLGDIAKVLA